MKTLLYRCPGKHQRPGGTYDYIGVDSQEKFDELLAGGWFETLPEAIDGKVKEKPVDDVTPPTRAELEEKAKELSLKFHGNISDEKLGKMIEEAI